MDNQDQGKNHSSGHESHVVYLCHKCGWPFPNPHPSAKHRRAHKKICGTIEGYKLVDSVDISHTTASDDEPHSDEDHKTPIAQVPKVVDRGSMEKSIGGSGAVSHRSEDEVFSDAAMEFQDSEFGLGRQDSLDNASKADKIAEKDLIATISFKDCEDTDFIHPPQNSADRSQKENPALKSMPIPYMDTLELRDLGLSHSTKDSENRNGSAIDAVPIKAEVPLGVLEETTKVSAGDGVIECSGEQENDASKNEGKLTKNLSSGLILPTEHAGEISETVFMSEKELDVTLDMVLTDKMIQLEEEFSDRLASKTSRSKNGERETDVEGSPGINVGRNLMDVVVPDSVHASVPSKKTEDITSETGLSDKIVELEEYSDKFDDLSPKAESAKDMDASKSTFQIKTDAAQGIDSASCVHSIEVYDKKEKEGESVYVLSVPHAIPYVDNAEIKLEGFKDHQRVKLPQTEAFASKEIIIDKEDEVRDHVSQEKSDTFQANQLHKDIKVGISYMHAAEDGSKLGGNGEAMVKEVLVEGEADELQINKVSDSWGSPVGADATENEKEQKVCPYKEQQSAYVSDDLQQIGFMGSMINVLTDVNPLVADVDIEARMLDNEVGSDDMGFPETARGAFDIAGGDNIRRVDDENYVKDTVALCETTNNSSLSRINPASNLLEVDNSDDVGTRKAKKYDINVIESGDGMNEGCHSMKTDCRSESISTLHQSLPETEGPKLNGVSDSRDGIKESEINRDNKVQGECAVEDLMASAVNNSGRNEFERISEDQLKKELMHSPSYAEHTVDDSDTREFGVDASGISTIILQGEADNGSVKPQLYAPVVDVPTEPSSQTDSLEGHCGSVSVSEAEKANIKNPKVASEEQHCDNLDEFEPPSFMTLVEPRGSDEKAAASKIQMVQNAQDPRAAPLQAGWFPSLTHVANESPGRKKNEEIVTKITNWNAKQHTPLKNLLGESNSETKLKSPNSKENPAVVMPREEKVAKDNEASVTKISSILGPETPSGEPTPMEAGKEWNSPARYPADIKRRKRKEKGRPLWAQFVCCSSVN